MVHNGIEYSIMQMMSEAYDIYRKVYGLDSKRIAEIFAGYNRGRLDSYLFEIAVHVLEKPDEATGEGYLIDKILDRAGAKGTGLWTSTEGLERGVSVSTITEATVARMISGEKTLRTKLSKIYVNIHKTQKPSIELDAARVKIENALYAGMILSYAQGLALIERASNEKGWDIDLAEVTRIWQGGCIIRAKLLAFLTGVLGKGNTYDNILELSEIHESLEAALSDYRAILTLALENGIATPSLSSGINYLHAITEDRSPANFIQGLRDYFGAHTYERVDMEGIYHTKW